MIRVPDLHSRRLTPEQMDDSSLPAEQHLAALDALARIHRVGGSARLLWDPLERLARGMNRSLRVLDVATGGGDLLLDLAARDQSNPLPSAARRDPRSAYRFDLNGCDLSEVGLERARAEAAARGIDARFFRFDALSGAAPEGAPYDVVMCSLFLHHLEDDEARAFLRGARSWATSAVLIHDLTRSKTGWRLAWLASRVLSRSPVVHFDALRSVEGAFTSSEVQAIAAEAGLAGAGCSSHWPERYLLEWRP